MGVLRGGPSGEHDVSLKTGAAVLRNLPSQFSSRDIFIDRAGAWHVGGVPIQPARAVRQCDAVFNALHGEFGEDGGIQNILDNLGVPYTGARAMPSALGMNKAAARRVFEQVGLRVPCAHVVRRGEDIMTAAQKIIRTFPQPSVVKPPSGGSSLNVHITRTFTELENALAAVLDSSNTALVEEYISGREATCGVLEGFRGEALYALPPIEIIPETGKTFFDYEAKYGGGTRELCPAHFDNETKQKIMTAARTAHVALGAEHYSRSDFIISKRGIFILEINTLPGLTEQSLLPKACAAVGCSFPQFLEHLINLAFMRQM